MHFVDLVAETEPSWVLVFAYLLIPNSSYENYQIYYIRLFKSLWVELQAILAFNMYFHFFKKKEPVLIVGNFYTIWISH